MGINSFFKKAGKSVSNAFKKSDASIGKFFNKLPSQVEHASNVVAGGLNTGLNAVGNVARKVGNTLEKAAPFIEAGVTAFAPELAVPVMGALAAGSLMSKNIRSGVKAGQGSVNQLATTANTLANRSIQQGQGQYNQLSNKLNGMAQNAITQGQTSANTLSNTIQQRANQGKGMFNNAVRNVQNQAQNAVNLAQAQAQDAIAQTASQITIH